jgi:hypothetical protein
MTTTLQRFSLDKKAPGLFKEASGGWCKYADALAAIEAAVRARGVRGNRIGERLLAR